jgi:hypothetical protein
LPLLLGFLPEAAAIKWSMLAHIALGIGGVWALSRRLGLSALAAATGSLAFGLNTYLLGHFRVGHLSHLYPMTLLPWCLYLVWRALDATLPERPDST